MQPQSLNNVEQLINVVEQSHDTYHNTLDALGAVGSMGLGAIVVIALVVIAFVWANQ